MMQRFKKAKTVWLERKTGLWGSDEYVLRNRKKETRFGIDIAAFCIEDFERITGIRLEAGEILKVNITVEEA